MPKATKMRSEEPLMSLPSPIVIDILSRLPAKNIVQSRCVCKTWFKLLSEPEFVNLHLSRSPACLLTNNLSSSPPDSSYFSFVELEDATDRHDLHYVADVKLELPKVLQDDATHMVGSINGFVCSYEIGQQYHIVHIWNPTMREFITIQTPKFVQGYSNTSSHGFGLSSVKDHYKVVAIFQVSEKIDSPAGSQYVWKSQCHVYTLGTGLWRRIGHPVFVDDCRGNAIFLNGNLHWLTEDLGSGSEIIMFYLDLETELFQPFPAPELNEEYGRRATLNLYNGCLCVCDNSLEFEAVVWVMKEYGVENSWSKQFVITADPVGSLGNYFSHVYIINVFKDGEVLVLLGNDVLLSYHPLRETSTILNAQELIRPCNARISYHEEHYGPSFEATRHVSSFLSLNNFSNETVNRI